MQHSFYDYKKFAILYVDDEEKSLKYFDRAFRDQFTIHTASNAQDGFKLLEQYKDEIGILMTDQRMPGEKGVQLLEKARQLRPRIIRILATAYSDIEAAVDAVNSGAIYKYVSKPWDVPQLEQTLRRALEFFIVQRERDHLLKEKLAVLHNIMITDRVVSLGVLAAGLGHHIRNALVAVRTFLDLAPEKLKDETVDLEELRNPTFWQDFYGHVQGQIKKITELLGDLGIASRDIEPDFRDEVSVSALLHEVVNGFQRETAQKEVQIGLNLPDDLPIIKADQPKLRRLFQLLIQDELLNLPAGGTISISGNKGEGLHNKLQVELSFIDNGPGLAKESLRSVFDPFFLRSNKPGEFGLNLMASFFLVYHHGGKIEVQSDSGKGTTFKVILPVNPNDKGITMREEDFLAQVLSNEVLWEKLLSGTL